MISTPALRGMRRRAVLRLMPALSLGAPFVVRAQDTSGPIRIRSSLPLSGPVAEVGQGLRDGAKAYFDPFNARGGVGGRLIDHVVRDDGYDAKRMQANTDEFLADPQLLSLYCYIGVGQVATVLPKILASGVPFFPPGTGHRPKNARNVFNLRPNYPEETERVVQHLATIGIQRIAIVQSGAYGQEVVTGANAALAHYPQVKLNLVAEVKPDGSDVDAAVQRLAASDAQAFIVGLVGKPALMFIKAMHAKRAGRTMYALSALGAASTIKAMGESAVGLATSQVVPMPNNTAVPVVREFQRDWAELKSDQPVSHIALEAYIGAKIFSEILRRAGRNVTRASFLDTAWALRRYDVGGFEVSFTDSSQSAWRYIDLAMVGQGGRFIR